MRSVLDGAAPADRPRPVIATALAVVVGDEVAARAAARAWMVPYCRAQNYQRSLAAQGFGPQDWEPPYSDRLVDTMVAWGSVEQVRQRIAEFHAAGADHVALLPVAADGGDRSMAALEALAPTS
jgi:alkanesulfonate monooxygenase SsuD/methylene tetrahydromethanopterin reductase-like flavin-dependent oxidoreductase (luciferase family)